MKRKFFFVLGISLDTPFVKDLYRIWQVIR